MVIVYKRSIYVITETQNFCHPNSNTGHVGQVSVMHVKVARWQHCCICYCFVFSFLPKYSVKYYDYYYIVEAGYAASLGPLLPCLPPAPFLPPSRPPLPLSILGLPGFAIAQGNCIPEILFKNLMFQVFDLKLPTGGG